MAATVACVAPFLTAGARASSAPWPDCDFLVASPTVAEDRTLFCVQAHLRPAYVWSSTDLGRTWTKGTLRGLSPSDTGSVSQVLPSRAYARDHVLYVRTETALYQSTDRGQTVSVADPLGGGLAHLPALAALDPRALGPALPAQPTLGQATQSQRPYLLLPPLRVTAAGAPGPLDHFMVAPPGAGAYADEVIGLGREVLPGAPGQVSWRAVLYACDMTLTCPSVTAKFAEREVVGQVTPAPDFARSGTVTFRTRTGTGALKLWVARDGGARLEPLTAAQAVVDGLVRRGAHVTGLRVTVDPRTRGRLYLRVGLAQDSVAIPVAQMFRSDDDGRTWRRIGYAHMAGKPWPRHRGLWPGPSRFGTHAGLGEEPLVVLSDGRMLAVGFENDRNRLYCSTDGARTWTRTCSR